MSGKAIEKRREFAPDRQPWDQQPWESSRAYHGFAVYRDLGFMRSLTKASQAIVETMTERKAPTVRVRLGEWSAKYRWVERAELYDRIVEERFRAQREGEIGKANRRYQAAAATMAASLLQRIAAQETNAGGAKPVDVNELDAEAIGRLLVNLQRVERIATGQPTELVKGAFTISTHDVEKISRDLVEGLMQFVPEERRALAAQWVMAYAQGAGQLAA